MFKQFAISGVLIILLVSGCIGQQTNQSGETIGQDLNVNKGGNMQQQNLHEDEHITDMPMEDVSAGEIEALNAALDDEYKAHATYAKVIEDFGQVKPFTNIITAEETHIAELLELYTKYDIEPIDDRWIGNIESFSSVDQACKVGVQAEIENADLYDELFSKVDNQDIIVVFTSLRDASKDKHLPAFQKCAGRNN